MLWSKAVQVVPGPQPRGPSTTCLRTVMMVTSLSAESNPHETFFFFFLLVLVFLDRASEEARTHNSHVPEPYRAVSWLFVAFMKC